MTYIVDDNCIKCKYMDFVDTKEWENIENKFELYFAEKPGK